MSNQTLYKNMIILIAAIVFAVIFLSIPALVDKQDAQEEGATTQLSLPTGPYMKHVVYESFVEPRNTVALNDVEVAYDELYKLIDIYKAHSSTEHTEYKKSKDGKIIVIDFYWKEHPSILLGSFHITKERAGLGHRFDCFVYECQI